MDATVIQPPALYEEAEDKIAESMTRWIPNFAKNVDRGAGDLVGDLEQIMEHRLWHVVGCDSMDDYARQHLSHSEHWCREVVRIFREEWDDAKKRTGTVGDLTFAEKNARRNERIHAMRDQGMTQQEIAKTVGKTRARVQQILQVKPVMPQKTCIPKRTRTVLQLSPGTDPINAATRIREKLGDEFARQLLTALQEKEDV